jgi:hypothetical protein
VRASVLSQSATSEEASSGESHPEMQPLPLTKPRREHRLKGKNMQQLTPQTVPIE